jgi:hypothetical protein
MSRRALLPSRRPRLAADGLFWSPAVAPRDSRKGVDGMASQNFAREPSLLDLYYSYIPIFSFFRDPEIKMFLAKVFLFGRGREIDSRDRAKEKAKARREIPTKIKLFVSNQLASKPN